jgi:tetratricopeptide (TPR) repeat protein/transglutaminase-like putative cysteine protease
MSLKTALAVLFLATIAFSPALAQNHPPQEKSSEKMAGTPVSLALDFSKEAYVVEKMHTLLTEEADGRGTREHTAEIRMIAEAGVKAFAVLNFTYPSANETVDVDYVRVRKPDGTIVKTPDYNIQDMPADVSRTAPMYSDIHEKHIAVKGLGVGDVLEYLVRYRVLKAEIPGQFWYEESFRKDAIVKDETVELNVPAEKYIKVASPDFKPVIKDAGARRIYTWTYSNLVVKEKDPTEIPRRIPPNPSVQITTFASWEDIGRWYGSLQKDPLEVTPAIQAKAVELTKGLKTDDEKIRALYNFVALKFHYIGLDFGIGRYQPHPADDVLGNGYGDCKDKHTLLASLLKAQGIEAWPALIHASRKLDPDVPSPAQFNHVITVVPRAVGFIWLDTTPEVAPYQLLMSALRDKQALVIPANKPPVLMTTPANPPFRAEQEFSMKGKLTADGTFTGHAEQSYRGDTEAMLRAWFRTVSQSQWKEAVQRFSYGLNFAGEVSNVTVSPPDDLDQPLRISYDYERKNYGDWENHQIVLPLPPMGVEVTKDSREKKPLEPVELGALGRVDYRARVELPPGYSMIAPSPVNLVEPYAEYHTTNVLDNGVLTTTRRFEIKKNEVALNDWDEFRKFGKAIGDDEFNFIRLSGSGAAFEVGTDGTGNIDETFRAGMELMRTHVYGQAEKSFQRVIASQPDYPMVHFNLGIVLFTEGKTDAALGEFHKQEDLTPTDVGTYEAAAFSMARVGRSDDAIGEWRRLLKANPQNTLAPLRVGQLLSLQGKYSEAIEELEPAVKSSPDNVDLQYSLGTAYLKNGKTDKGVEHLRAAAEAKHDPMVLNNVAYALAEGNTNLELAQQYGEDALSQLDRKSVEDGEDATLSAYDAYQFALVWDTVGWIYFQGGDADRAENFVRAAWLLGQAPVVGEHLGEIYEKEGKNKEAAHVYELTLAAIGVPLYGMSATPPAYPGMTIASPATLEREALATKIAARCKKLTGKTPLVNETWRLPNGEWSKSASEQLSLIRTAKFGKLPGLKGSAEFTIAFAPGKIKSVTYVNGEQSLKVLTEKIEAAHFQVEFPTGSHANLVRRAEVSCFPLSGCMAVLVPTSQPPGRPGPAQQ